MEPDLVGPLQRDLRQPLGGAAWALFAAHLPPTRAVPEAAGGMAGAGDLEAGVYRDPADFADADNTHLGLDEAEAATCT